MQKKWIHRHLEFNFKIDAWLQKNCVM